VRCSHSLVLLLTIVAACSTSGSSPSSPSSPSSGSDGEARPSQPIETARSINQRFVAEDLDVDRFVGIFESESREVFRARDEIVGKLELTPGMAIADVGAGTGLFLESFAEAVGPEGRVYAVEISPRFLDHLRERSEREGLDRVTVVRADPRSVELPPASVDVAFVCDTYHHFEYPKETLASLLRAIRPGGSLVIVDFVRVPGVSADWVLDHVRADREAFSREIEEAGFERVGEIPVEELRENYVLRFRRP